MSKRGLTAGCLQSKALTALLPTLVRQARLRLDVFLLLVLAALCAGRAMGSVTASISGTVRDRTGATVVGAVVTVTQAETGTAQTEKTNAQGYYSFPSLPLGHFNLQVERAGFKRFEETGLVLDVNSTLVVDANLDVGGVQEVVEVSGSALHVETSSTQLGEVISGNEMTGVPLVTRSYTDLLALQPGVVPTPSGMSGALAGPFNSTGIVLPQVSGDLNAGGLSVNGMREANNGFLLNGATVQEPGFGGTAVVPNLDSIAEFRIITNNFDAEYGNYSGGQINVITKSGSNQFHGNLFEFLRNTDLDAANYFDQGSRGVYHQNQYGGTLGGPVIRDKVFFFGDYQGNRVVQGISSGQVAVPAAAEHAGDFSGVASSLTGSVVGPAWAQQLSSELNYNVSQGEPYYTPGCNSTAQCVFPNAKIPASAISPIASNILPSIPNPNSGAYFSTSSQAQRLEDSKTSGRADGNTRFGQLAAYYFWDSYSLASPYPTATVPGFPATGTGLTQVANVSDTKTFGAAAVNEFRIEYMRNNILLNQPANGGAVTLSSLGFTTGSNTLGIAVLNPAIQGIPELDFNNFVVGVPSRPNRFLENTYQVLDNFSKVFGTHTFKAGGAFHYNQMDQQLSNVVNGNFVYNTASETGVDFADFLIGAPAQFVQGVALPGNGRSHYIGLYGQDSWRVSTSFTVNYGLRWDVSAPWSEQHNELETLVPGLQSQVFPGAPTGWVFPTDPGIPPTLAPIRYNNFAPRLGIAYSPDGGSGFFRKLIGPQGTTSIRAGYGLFYTAFEGAGSFNEIGAAPFGFFYVGNNPQFATPFVSRPTAQSQQQRFPVVFPADNVSASNPDNSVNWSLFLPIASSPGFYYKNRLPYAEDYELSIQREFGPKTVATVSYVGTQGHRLLATLESNPGNPALCLSVSQTSQVAPGSPVCGPNGENGVYTTTSGQVINSTRAPFGPNFGSNGYFITLGASNYNSLQVNVRHTSPRLQTLVGYTFSKSFDDSSGYGEQINPIDSRASYALSAFNSAQNFVVSYTYQMPFDKLGQNRLTNGWQLSGITRFAAGLPVTVYENDDRSLLGTAFTGPIILDVDTPTYTPGPLHIANPRSGNPYFNTSLFSLEPLGELGNSKRRFFHGPGINNWDMALLKDTRITERVRVQFRAEFFNLFNHAQFSNVQGNINSSNFGQAQSANHPRIGQMALKLLF